MKALEAREEALDWLIKQLRMGRSRFAEPGVVIELAREEQRMQVELDELRSTARKQGELELQQQHSTAA